MRSNTPKAARKSGRRVDCADIMLLANLSLDSVSGRMKMEISRQLVY